MHRSLFYCDAWFIIYFNNLTVIDYSYILEITPLASFAVPQFSHYIEGTSFVSTALNPDKDYYWRVWPVNAQYTCMEYSDIASFTTGVLSEVETIEGVDAISVFPNPLSNGNKLRVHLDAAAPMSLKVNLLAATGQQLQQFSWETNVGHNNTLFETTNLPAGVYFVQIQSDKGVMNRKVIVK